MMKFFAILAAVTIATTSAATCNMTALLPLAQDADFASCTADSGLTLPPTSALDAATLKKACASKGCNGLLSKVVALKLGDCSIGTFKVETDLINPLKKACTAGSGKAEEYGSAGSDSSEVTVAPVVGAGSSKTDASVTKAPAAAATKAPAAAASGASAVTIAAGAAVAAVAASLW